MEYNIISTIDGKSASFNDQNHLFIQWAKAYNKIYCHHAYIVISAPELTLFDEQIAEITVEKIINFIDKKTIVGATTFALTRFLPFTIDGNKINIPLNDEDLIKILTLNFWTKCKDNSESQLKEAPNKLTWIVGKSVNHMDFDCNNSCTPYMMIQEVLSSLSNGDIANQTIII